MLLEAGRSYPLLGANKPEPTHYQIRLAVPAGDRWVPVDCGRTEVTCQGTGCDGGGNPREYVLAVSWQPAFCEGHAAKPECASQTSDRFDASHLTLHGLWPQYEKGYPESCATSFQLAPQTVAKVLPIMPSPKLIEHEWQKHGTCSGLSSEQYFAQVETVFAGLVIPEPYRQPSAPVVTNVEATPNADPSKVKELLLRQVTGSVRWIECVQALEKAGVTKVVELGPGKVLCGLVKRISKGIECVNVEDPASLEKALAAAP